MNILAALFNLNIRTRRTFGVLLGLLSVAFLYYGISTYVVLRDGTDPIDIANKAFKQANILYERQEYKKAYPLTEKAVEAYRVAGDLQQVLETYLLQTRIAYQQGNIDDALISFKLAIALADTINNPSLKGHAFETLSALYLAGNVYDKALQAARQAADQYLNTDLPNRGAVLYVSIGDAILLKAKDNKAAIEQAADAYTFAARIYASQGDLFNMALMQERIGDVAFLQKDFTNAALHWHDAEINFSRAERPDKAKALSAKFKQIDEDTLNAIFE